MSFFIIVLLMGACCSFWNRRDIRSPHRWAVIPTSKLRILKAMVSSLIAWWSAISILSLLSLLYVDFGMLELNFSQQISVILPLSASVVAAVQAKQLLHLRTLYTARIIEGPVPVEISPRFKELLEAFQTSPSPQLLEALLREIGPPPKARKFFRRGLPDTGFDL